MTVVIDTKSVLPFMRQLCSSRRHKFTGFFNEEPEQLLRHSNITVLGSSVSPIDREGNLHFLYRYGQDAVVELNLVCEYVFNKHGYAAIKPKLIQKAVIKEQW